MPRKCSVPLCRTNYSGETRFNTFGFPKDPRNRTRWLRAVPRKDFIPGKHACVCIKHFEERFIERENRATRDDGSILVVPLARPRLLKNAVPTIFSYPISRILQLLKKDPSERHIKEKSSEIPPEGNVGSEAVVTSNIKEEITEQQKDGRVHYALQYYEMEFEETDIKKEVERRNDNLTDDRRLSPSHRSYPTHHQLNSDTRVEAGKDKQTIPSQQTSAIRVTPIDDKVLLNMKEEVAAEHPEDGCLYFEMVEFEVIDIKAEVDR